MFRRTKWNSLTCFDICKNKTRGKLSIFLSWLLTNVSILNLSLFKHGNSLSAYNYNIPGNKKEYNISYHYFLLKYAVLIINLLVWENSRHLAKLPLVFPPNDVWETSSEIPYWWRVTTQIWVVRLIGRAAWEIWFNQSEAVPRSG